MESIDEFTISQYMALDSRIKHLRQKKIYKHWAFYQQSFCTTIAYTGYEVVAQAIRADRAIEKLDGTLRLIDHRIEILNMKNKFWKKFLSSLSSEERQYFQDKYIKGHIRLNGRLDNLATEEIDEINQAITMCFCTKSEYKEAIQLVENDFMGNIDRLLNVVGV
ncbi:hypothetical protein FH947_001906 [Enterococcus faecalis]|uniref:hypothetical protein n=1 Tax=Enterococcus faecalis TaxID=1351 RepID=UPI001A062D81|nr:hypothetical protein [Enterococcus faecalis]EGO7832338.1 hypothetical protein [Enterococcus faecalis]EGO8121908.1 hypothetical protein [Enterococcus faecalis]EKK0978267.1 hypothetical protein [Enterococcus faecalis]EKZ0164253.1 hypothetical protein [Enterococcus faecalis]EKZ0220904.1 hypothetical protein [Enterococcus faecalis]